MSVPALVSIEFVIPNQEVRKFELQDVAAMDVNEVHPVARDSNTSYEYSGRHDEGSLPTLRNDGSLASVLSALQAMRSISDEYLTEQINRLSGPTTTTTDHEESLSKKMRMENVK
jgi:hypothetical protein